MTEFEISYATLEKKKPLCINFCPFVNTLLRFCLPPNKSYKILKRTQAALDSNIKLRHRHVVSIKGIKNMHVLQIKNNRRDLAVTLRWET